MELNANDYKTKTTLTGAISEEHAKEMIKAAADDAAARSKPQIPNGDKEPITHCVWFSLEQINKMVAILNLEKFFGCKTDGVRVYFAKYTENTAPEKSKKQYIGRDTVVFVSTKKHDDGVSHIDYFDHLLPESTNEDKHEMLPENRGELCEPKSACIGSQFE
ncbi:MAG: hypothetical protein V5804_08650 [Mucilaginibacter sp.]|uniref:hypothetical protein n=1 Tax=Mucilaginibacter sp. TaxID=1882438 RepID=UPI0034E5CF4F